MAIRQRNQSLIRYYVSPNICGFCHKIISVPEGVQATIIRSKKYCDASCSAKANNGKRPARHRFCKGCNCDLDPFHKVFKNWCFECQRKRILLTGQMTKKQCRIGTISYHARRIINGEITLCQSCGYDKFVEIAHIKPVSSFSADSLVKVINDRNNLVALCPNCHWEFDHGRLILPSI